MNREGQNESESHSDGKESRVRERNGYMDHITEEEYSCRHGDDKQERTQKNNAGAPLRIRLT